MEFDQICVEIEEEERVAFVGPQIKLDMGEGSSIHDDLPAVEVPGVVPTVVVEEEDSSVEIIISGKEMKPDQAEATGGEPVPEDAQSRREGLVVGTGEPVPDVGRSGEEPDLMEVDPVVRTGEVPVQEVVEEGTRLEPIPEVAEERTGGELVHEEAAEAAGAEPIQGIGEDDLHFEDFPGDEFMKVGEFTPEESSQTPPAPVPK